MNTFPILIRIAAGFVLATLAGCGGGGGGGGGTTNPPAPPPLRWFGDPAPTNKVLIQINTSSIV